MKNTYISILLFIALVGTLFFLNSKFIKLCDTVIEECNTIEELLDNGEKELSYNYSKDLLNTIIDEADIPAIYLNHVDYDVLKSDALKLTVYIKSDDKSESLATLHTLRSTAEHLKELQKPNLKNIF